MYTNNRNKVIDRLKQVRTVSVSSPADSGWQQYKMKIYLEIYCNFPQVSIFLMFHYQLQNECIIVIYEITTDDSKKCVLNKIRRVFL